MEMQAQAQVRDARRAALNLLEDAETARNAAQLEMAERRRTEEELAAELAATRLLQALGSRLIRDDDGEVLYEEILDAALALLHSPMASIQIFDTRKKALRLLGSRGFHPDAAAAWEWITANDGSVCAEALLRMERVVVTDVEDCEFIAGTLDSLPSDETFNAILSGAEEIRARGGYIIGISPFASDVWDEHIQVGDVGEAASIVNAVPPQVLAYHLALQRGLDPDKPRNLAKSVTVK